MFTDLIGISLSIRLLSFPVMEAFSYSICQPSRTIYHGTGSLLKQLSFSLGHLTGFLLFFFSLSLFSFATFDFGYILTAFSSPIVAAVSFIERTLGVDMKLVQSVSRSALAATMADSNPKCVA